MTMPEAVNASAFTRCTVAALDEILGHPFPVLDHGYVRVVDYMGDDSAIVQAARVSYGAGTKRIQEDRGLIRYLMRHWHTTPFEMCEIKLHVKVPMDAWRQWIRHRTANVNEYSTRYSIAIDEARRTAPHEWRTQSTHNRQGSEGALPQTLGTELSSAERELQDHARTVYQARLAAGVAREQARKDLPLSTFTEAYWKIDLHNLLHFLRLRMDDRTQYELRTYAKTIGEEIVARWVPVVWEAFRDYRLEAFTLSGIEARIVAALTRSRPGEAHDLAARHGFINRGSDGRLSRSRERQELESKLDYLGLPVPWCDIEPV